MRLNSIIAMDLGFDFAKVCFQGTYFSSFIPHSLADYLIDPFIPQSSRYHMVGCCPSLLPNLAKMDSLHLVQRYIQLFYQRKTVIDLCLPYYDSKHHRSYIGRFIIYCGKLKGIRLSTAANGMFSAWQRHKVIKASLKMNQTQTQTLLIGQFGLNLTNVRMGLLFDSQLSTIANQYVNCCFDVIAMTRVEWSVEQKIRAKINQISIRTLLIETNVSAQAQLLGQKQLNQLKEGNIKNRKRLIFLDYFEFQRVFANKKWLKLQKNQRPVLQYLYIDLYLAQSQKIILQNTFDTGRYVITSSRLKSLLPNKPLPQKLRSYLCRISTLIQFCESKKIVLVVDETPTSICLLLMLKNLFSNVSQIKDIIHSLFVVLVVLSQKLDLFLQRLDIIDLSKCIKLEQSKFSSIQCNLLNKLDQISSRMNQQWIPVVGNSAQLKIVIELINKRRPANEKQNNNYKLPIHTWLMCDFFSFQELVSLYFSQQVKQMLVCEQYWQQIWQRHKLSSLSYRIITPTTFEQVINLSLSKFQINYQLGKNHIEPMLRFSNALLYQFQLWLCIIGSSNLQKEKLFCHFLFREIGVASSTFLPEFGQYMTNFVEELMALPKDLILVALSFFRESDLSSRIRLQHNFVLRKCSQEIKASAGKKQCHSCGNEFEMNLLFRCKYEICNQLFCYHCLFHKFYYSVQYLVAKRNYICSQQPQLGKCPACRGLCSSNCYVCSKRMADNKLQKGNIQSESTCHICKRQVLFFTTCSNDDCREVFCEPCYIKLKTVTKYKTQIIDWICPVCQNKCYCNLCQSSRDAFKSEHISRLKPFQCNAQNNLQQPLNHKLQRKQNIYNPSHLQQPIFGKIAIQQQINAARNSKNYEYNCRKSSENQCLTYCVAQQNEQTSLIRPSQLEAWRLSKRQSASKGQ